MFYPQNYSQWNLMAARVRLRERFSQPVSHTKAVFCVSLPEGPREPMFLKRDEHGVHQDEESYWREERRQGTQKPRPAQQHYSHAQVHRVSRDAERPRFE
jgi:hypothetical protein